MRFFVGISFAGILLLAGCLGKTSVRIEEEYGLSGRYRVLDIDNTPMQKDGRDIFFTVTAWEDGWLSCGSHDERVDVMHPKKNNSPHVKCALARDYMICRTNPGAVFEDGTVITAPRWFLIGADAFFALERLE